MAATVEKSIRRSEDLDPKLKQKLTSLAKTDSIEGQLQCLLDVHEATLEDYLDKLRDNSKKSFSCYIEYMTPDEPPPPHIDWLCEKLEAVERRDIMRLLISMPPGHAKSKTCSRMFPSWYLGKNQYHKFLQGGHTQKFCEDQFGKLTRDLIDTPEYQKLFPEARLSQSTKGGGAWNLSNNRGGYVCKGVGQGISGYRGNCLVIDDPFATYEDSQSPTVRDRVFNWYINDMAKRMLPFSPILIVATRWHPEDLCGRLEDMGNEGKGRKWEVINLPFEARPEWHEGGLDPLGREHGELLWDFYEHEYQDIIQTTPTHMYNALYMGKPTNEDGEVLQQDWIQRYDKPPANVVNESGHVIERNIKRIVASVDCANTDKERSAYTVVTVWLEDVYGNHYLLHTAREKVQFSAMINLIDRVCKRYRCDAVLVENQGAGIQYISYMKKNDHNVKPPCSVIEIETSNKSKEFRFDATTTIWEAGKVYLPKHAKWLPDYERELLEFPAVTFKDQVDSTSQYLEWSKPKTTKLGSQKLVTSARR